MKMRLMKSIWILAIMAFGCTQTSSQTMNEEGKNRLAKSTSPYLLQHADNPVDWYPWGEEALQKAKSEDKPIIVSIGYSSCHWCHVMAHESFEDDSIAAIMNANFINIKIDREERPDIDQIYMEAVAAMGINGGWPLNVFLTPDQKPFYGGTYFPKKGWQELLLNVSGVFKDNRTKLEESANQITDALKANASEKYYLSPETEISLEQIEEGYQKFTTSFDPTWGGLQKAPKFPMPSQWSFLTDYYYITENDELKDHLLFTLDKIGDGGIYDQIGGGFARYSVDGEWHVPHFEKMLYDNGQLLSLYAKAYRLENKPRYKEIMLETAEWLKREMLDPNGGFYAALDADSEGVEGKFYVWSYDEVVALAGNNLKLISDYYDISPGGNWEGHNVFRRLNQDTDLATKHGLSIEQLNRVISEFKQEALVKREERVRPGLDNKIITGWNALTLTGLLDAYQATGEKEFLALAESNYQFISSQLLDEQNGLLHVLGQSTQAFAEDYSAVIQAFIKYYETKFDTQALEHAQKLTNQLNAEFYDPNEKLFYFTSQNAENLIARKNELLDNVIPSPSSMMAENLIKLGLHLDSEEYKLQAYDMINNASDVIKQEIGYMAQWASATTFMLKSVPEIAIVGPKAMEMAAEFNSLNIPRKVISATVEESDLPLLEYKSAIGGETTIYVCFNKACKMPVNSIEKAVAQIPK